MKYGFRNWWYYYKWYCLLGAAGVIILFGRLADAFGWFERKPDIQIAYIGSVRLPEEYAAGLEEVFACAADDFNRDGTTTAVLHQYILEPDGVSEDAMYARYAAEIEIIGDITDCDSYLFLMEDPADVQRRFQILADPDGNPAGPADLSVTDKCIRWKDSDLLAIVSPDCLGDYEEAAQELYLGRRAFETEKTTKYLRKCEELWKTLNESQGQVP